MSRLQRVVAEPSSTGPAFYRSSDLTLPFRVKIVGIEARLLCGKPVEEMGASSWDLYVTCQIFSNGGKPLCLPEQTAHRPMVGRPIWNEWLALPVTLDALPSSALVVFTVWDCGAHGEPVAVGGTTVPIFRADAPLAKMVKGRKRLYLWPRREGSGADAVTTPWDAAQLDESDRLERCVARYDKHKVDRVAWLDPYAFAEIRRLQDEMLARRRMDVAFVTVEFPSYRHAVVFHERQYVSHPDESDRNEIVTVFDPELSQSNPVDEKFQRMRRYQIGLEAMAKPTNQEKKELARIIGSPPTKQLTEAEKNNIWMFRSFLKGSVAALPKFLLSVDWSIEAHAAEAVRMMREAWVTLSIEVALELLSEQFSDAHHAVRYLDSISDDELTRFLLQLVQAMRPERSTPQRPLTAFLLRRSQNSLAVGTRFLWYMKVESEQTDDDGVWYKAIVQEFLDSLKEEEHRDMYRRQDLLVRTLRDLYRHLCDSTKNRNEMIDVMRREIASGHFSQLRSFQPLALPLNPEIVVVGMMADKCTVFKSAQKPLGLCFQQDNGSPYMVLFKVGNDLRCDQLVLQIVSLMDNIVKRDGNLDLKLSPYHVLATGRMDGMIELVPDSISVAACLKSYDNDIAAYFRKLHPSPSSPFGIKPKILDNFVRSCAGYCVITYLLGIGDRHLDNLLLTSNGYLFHIDFGFILGEDPKSWPPPMKITREMVLAMGGDDSQQYYQFRSLCCECFSLLRRRSNLVITLFSLMLRAGIVNGHRTLDNPDNLFKIQDKYSLDQSEEASIETIQSLIQKSVAALMPRLFEDIHTWAQYWRN